MDVYVGRWDEETVIKWLAVGMVLAMVGLAVMPALEIGELGYHIGKMLWGEYGGVAGSIAGAVIGEKVGFRVGMWIGARVGAMIGVTVGGPVGGAAGAIVGAVALGL